MSVGQHLFAGQITVKSALLFRALDDLSRSRELTIEESLLLERLLRHKKESKRQTFRWTPQADLELIEASHRYGGVIAFASDHGISKHAAYSRLNKVRSLAPKEEAR